MGRRCWGLAVSVVTTLSLAGGPAAAQEARATMLTVTLKDGSMFQGELVERIPGDHVTLRLATGEVRRFEAADLAVAPLMPPAPFTLPSSVPSADDGYAGPGGVRVHVESNKPFRTELFQAAPAGPDVGWNRLCHAPCDRLVDPRGLYRIGGESIVESDTFRLSSVRTQTLYVDATTRGTPTFAWISTTLGLALTIPGLYLFTHADGGEGSKIAGGVVLANGVPWLITGIVLFAVGGTTVKNDAGTRIASRSTERSVALGGPFRLTGHGVTF